MKKIKEMKEFETLEVYKNSIIVKNKKSIQLVNESLNLTSLIDANIYSFKILDDKLFYQLDDSFNLHIYDNGLEIKDNIGFALHSALYCTPYIYIYGGKDDTSIFLDFSLKSIIRAPEYCFASYKNFLFDYNKNIIVCYQLNNKLWNYIHNDDSKLRIISGYKNKLLIYSESGDLFALNLSNGELCWKYPEQCPYGRYGFFDNCIYHMYKNEFREIFADTGQIFRVMDIRDLREKEHFFATAGIKVYDDYILCKDVDGAVAVIDRKNLILKEIIRFEHHLGNWTFPFLWVNNRLYVQDIEKVIHVFE